MRKLTFIASYRVQLVACRINHQSINIATTGKLSTQTESIVSVAGTTINGHSKSSEVLLEYISVSNGRTKFRPSLAHWVEGVVNP